MNRRFLCSLLLPLAACSSTMRLESSWSSWSWLGGEPSSETKTLTADCSDTATRVDAQIRVTGSTGEIVLRVVDPDGIERLRQSVTAGSCEVSQRWQAVAGTWSLHVEPKDFVGSYSVEIKAGDEPVTVRVDIAGDLPR
ncbi:MAG: hypothetical protein JNK78_20765 [Planctomycetes bacterium]|nr:hypothetical protein [Planctomycetota bacterium]